MSLSIRSTEKDIYSKLEYTKRGRNLSVSLWQDASSNTSSARYLVSVVDSQNKAKLGRSSCGVLLIPQGRENEWLFGVPEGQANMCQNSGYARLIFVSLNRGHKFTGMSEVQKELSPAIRLLVQENAKKNQIPYLTVEDGIGQRDIVAEYTSSLQGNMVVEDIPFKEDGHYYRLRRLVFLSTRLIQSETRFLKNKEIEFNTNQKKTMEY